MLYRVHAPFKETVQKYGLFLGNCTKSTDYLRNLLQKYKSSTDPF